jgi:hypothetical protein
MYCIANQFFGENAFSTDGLLVGLPVFVSIGLLAILFTDSLSLYAVTVGVMANPGNGVLYPTTAEANVIISLAPP